MKIKKNLSWKDDWIDKSPAPMTEMFYKNFKRLPDDEELKKFINLFVMPKNENALKRKFEEFVKFVDENDKKREQ